MTTGQKLNLVRKERGLTQKALADKLGLKPQANAQWEFDLREPKLSTIIRIADALEISFANLLAEEIYKKLYDHFTEENNA